jgi:hypothetical protein
MAAPAYQQTDKVLRLPNPRCPLFATAAKILSDGTLTGTPYIPQLLTSGEGLYTGLLDYNYID